MSADTIELHRVRVWFGEHPIGDYTGDREHAARVLAGWQRRFPGMRVTDETLPLSGIVE